MPLSASSKATISAPVWSAVAFGSIPVSFVSCASVKGFATAKGLLLVPSPVNVESEDTVDKPPPPLPLEDRTPLLAVRLSPANLFAMSSSVTLRVASFASLSSLIGNSSVPSKSVIAVRRLTSNCKEISPETSPPDKPDKTDVVTAVISPPPLLPLLPPLLLVPDEDAPVKAPREGFKYHTRMPLNGVRGVGLGLFLLQVLLVSYSMASRVKPAAISPPLVLPIVRYHSTYRPREVSPPSS